MERIKKMCFLFFIQCWLGNGHKGQEAHPILKLEGAAAQLPPQNHVEELGDFQTPWEIRKGLNHRRTPLPGNPKCSFDLNPIGIPWKAFRLTTLIRQQPSCGCCAASCPPTSIWLASHLPYTTPYLSYNHMSSHAVLSKWLNLDSESCGWAAFTRAFTASMRGWSLSTKEWITKLP